MLNNMRNCLTQKHDVQSLTHGNIPPVTLSIIIMTSSLLMGSNASEGQGQFHTVTRLLRVTT